MDLAMGINNVDGGGTNTTNLLRGHAGQPEWPLCKLWVRGYQVIRLEILSYLVTLPHFLFLLLNLGGTEVLNEKTLISHSTHSWV